MSPLFSGFHMAAVLLTMLSPRAEDADVPHVATLPAVASASVVHSDTIRVAAPTGEKETDRANVQAAFDAVQPGGTVLFGPGTYLLGEGARLTVPDVTVLGHPEGTVLRGCDPEAFDVDGDAMWEVVFGCTGLFVQTERQTIHGLTFEYTWHGIVIGPYPASAEEAQAAMQGETELTSYPAGGQRIEGNTFRASPNGLRVLGTGEELSIVRDNDFIDVFHAIGIYGAPLHFMDNRVTVAEPGSVPFSRHPGSAVLVSPGQTDCAGHVVAGNRIEGYPDPIYVLVRRGETCRGVEIRDNTIHAARVKIPAAYLGATPTEDDSTMVGAPITLMNRTEPRPGGPEADTEGVLEDILVQGNQILGAEGLGILIQDVSRSRIADNTIVGVERRDPFPGITWDGFEPRWEAANGSAIWLSPGSDHNEIVGNTFEDVASAAVFLEGDSNHVEVRSDADSVRDQGTGNRVDAPGTTTRHPKLGEVAYESSFVQVRGIRMHYLDFGGPGIPVIFIHGSHADARSFVDFAPRFADAFRVLAPDRRGHGESENVDWGHGTAAQAEDILGFMDALGLQRAVLIDGNVGLTTYLGEHHPDRLAGIVFLRHMAPQVESRRDSSVAEFWDMASRTACDWDEETRQRNTRRDGYRPHFIDDPDFRIDVPALSLANADGTRHPAGFDFVGIFLDQVETGEWCDTTAKAYFSALAADTARATELRNRLGDLTGAANQSAFERAFGPRMTVVRLSVPAVTGYEYLRAPDLIYPHIRTFLEGLAGGDP